MDDVTAKCSAGGKQWAERHPEITKQVNQAIAKRRAEDMKKKERPVDVVIELTCTPSTLEDIKLVLKSYETTNRVLRFYPHKNTTPNTNKNMGEKS